MQLDQVDAPRTPDALDESAEHSGLSVLGPCGIVGRENGKNRGRQWCRGRLLKAA